MISPGLFMMIGGIIGCAIFAFLAIRSHSRWKDERDAFVNSMEGRRTVRTPRNKYGMNKAETVFRCPNCGAEVKPGSSFCEQCGIRL